jgi:ABC-type branched-subunit amino acid transport system permease subunit
MLDSCLVSAQAMVLNRLSIPFVAVTAFSGISAYAVALWLNGSKVAPLFSLLLTIVIVAGLSLFAHLLPQDQYLLATLAILGVLRASAGSIEGFGGQLGLSSAGTTFPPQSSLQFMVAALVLFATSLITHLVINRSEFGLATTVTRISRSDQTARAFVPVKKIVFVCFLVTAVIAAGAGVLKALYVGRVDPDQFRIRTAVILLMATLVVGYSPLRIAVLSLFFFAFPDLFGYLFGYSASSLAFIREMVWSILIMVLVSRNLTLRSRFNDVTSALNRGLR